MMKKLMTLFAVLSIHTVAIAGNKTCEKLAADTASSELAKENSDDCFVRFVQPSIADKNIINVGIACDHSGSYIYQAVTSPNGSSCTLLKMSSEAIDRDL